MTATCCYDFYMCQVMDEISVIESVLFLQSTGMETKFFLPVARRTNTFYNLVVRRKIWWSDKFSARAFGARNYIIYSNRI